MLKVQKATAKSLFINTILSFVYLSRFPQKENYLGRISHKVSSAGWHKNVVLQLKDNHIERYMALKWIGAHQDKYMIKEKQQGNFAQSTIQVPM